MLKNKPFGQKEDENNEKEEEESASVNSLTFLIGRRHKGEGGLAVADEKWNHQEKKRRKFILQIHKCPEGNSRERI